MLWKTTKTRRLFLFRKTIRSNISFTLIIELFWGFKIARFEFKVTVGLHYGLWAKCTQLWPLNLEPRLIWLESKNPFAHNYATQIMWLGSVHKYFGGGLGKMEGGPKKFWVTRRGGTKKFSVVKGGSKKFGQIESIMKIKMHNLLPKLTGYSLRLDLYFKIFPGPSAGPALHLTLKMPPLAHPQIRLAFF